MLANWEKSQRSIKTQLEFIDFEQAFKFMTEVVEVANRLNHHPEWFNVYNRVDIELTTHDVGGLSELDERLAEEIDNLLVRY
ncbi:pterin-4-alpha-carbinolamine dehydratase [Pseudomaricurvus alkylphenolicus]|uniref:4a-hydroxytetrahydrobiopterin dehydratase n=1 Tax=Pseudomaricurvus alkylphenolicus TaxID=1306991 RepID=UPI0014202DF4|nr:4a-hydroxytetrahydrobiopterin dehydratase [Pseudomaricurvus alkylphenolicus]NIB39005.1 pterin-4-alpha-carbinolamine dehydratase [Pseudomaricurvus alkylphenolicus]